MTLTLAAAYQRKWRKANKHRMNAYGVIKPVLFGPKPKKPMYYCVLCLTALNVHTKNDNLHPRCRVMVNRRRDLSAQKDLGAYVGEFVCQSLGERA